MIHNFNECLAFSESAGNEDFWQKVYEKAFPDLLFAKACTGKCPGQYLGIDRIIQLKSGKTIYIDEKKREKEWQDILLEYISSDKINSPGWIEKELLIDYMAYAFMPSNRCYLFPWQNLRRTWKQFKQGWIAKYPKIEAKNPTYKTISVAVPIEIVIREIKNSMIIQI